MASVLIFEPNQKLAQRLHTFLTKEGYTAVLCKGNQIPAQSIQAEPKKLAIIDAKMKWTDCRPLLETLAQNSCPVLFITADSNMSQHLKAIYPFRNDVLCYPFPMRKMDETVKQLMGMNCTSLNLSVDHHDKSVIMAGKRVALTAQEYALLVALMETPDVAVSREQLLRAAWGYQSMGETRTVDVHIQRLRKKLGGKFIETVYRFGYKLKTA